ncbi:MAG: A24 family peptidase [Oscillospiraceae bacterium]
MAFCIWFSGLLISAAVMDLKELRIPPLIPAAILVTAPLYTEWAFVPGAMGLLFGGGIFLLPTMIRPDAFGGGDIKLAAACGFSLGFSRCLLGLFVAILLSLMPCIYYSIKKSKTHIAFAPYLAAGFILAAFFV